MDLITGSGWKILNKAHWYKMSEIRTMLLDAYDSVGFLENEPPFIWTVLQEDSINELYEMLTSLELYGDENEFQYVSQEERKDFINFRYDVVEPPIDHDFLKMINQFHLSYQDEHYKYRNLPVGRVW
jgi:hypothetical protein